MLKNILRYLIIFSVTGVLLWVSVSQIELKEGETFFSFIADLWSEANLLFLILSAFCAIASHYIRALRWNLLLNPLGYHPSVTNNFLAVMIGYFVNLAIPRGGEISRCANLNRTDKVPIDTSIGTVVAERIMDLIFLFLFIAAAFLIEFKTLTSFFYELDIPFNNSSGKSSFPWVVVIITLFALSGLAYFLFIKVRHAPEDSTVGKLYKKALSIVDNLKDGALSIFKMEHNVLFMIYSILIWLGYYLMTYFVIIAFEYTESIGIFGALSIFVIGSVAMVIPTPGGTGSYHYFVSLGMVPLYGVEKDHASGFAFIFHGYQTLVLIIVGALSLILSQSRYQTNDKGQNKE